MTTQHNQQTDVEKAFSEARRGYAGENNSFEDSQNYYNRMAGQYDELMSRANSLCYSLTAEGVAKLYPPEVRDSLQILDVGAGTGMVADALRLLGFVHIDALDPNESMLNVARRFNRYRKYYVERVTSTERCSIKTGSFDVVTSCGLFNESGHMSPEALREVARLVKPGGHIVIINRLMQDKSLNPIEAAMKEIEVEKTWKMLSRDVWPGYNKATGVLGISWTFEIL